MIAFHGIILFRSILLMMICASIRTVGVHAFTSNTHRIQKAFRCRSFRQQTTLQASLAQSIESILEPTACEEWINVDLPEGRCMGVAIKASDAHQIITSACVADPNHWSHALFHPDELLYGLDLPASRCNSFFLGRLSMRLALDFPDSPILKDSVGRPLLTPGVHGSITHKDNVGIALVSKSPATAGVGVDLEYISRPGKRSIAKRVLTDNENQSLGGIPGISKEEEVMLRFSLKEAIYKAANPLLCQYVAFKEAEVTPHADGTATCEWYLESRADKKIERLTAHWRKMEDRGFFLTSARVQGSLDK